MLSNRQICLVVALPATHFLYDEITFIDRRCEMRKASEKRLQAIWQAVEQNPGVRPGQVAQALRISRSSVTRALPAMEEVGMLLSEDQRGRLWAWRKK